MTKSALQIARASYVPKIPAVFKGNIQIKEGEATASVDDQEEIKKLFPHIYGLPILTFVEAEGQSGLDTPINVGVILSGGQAPGGHNVIAGIYDGIKRLHSESRLYGFILGPAGLINHEYKELTGDIIDEYRNTG
ncbi:MAG: diphosphate--fructose-6-phosphate 1-phosphotransferase, partial [Dysgonamonadaceae bacterium]|nr:diphosphate--fructose-6-phosphate 1-phosphotransferase [Dysgonamonadaceae bacterium]